MKFEFKTKKSFEEKNLYPLKVPGEIARITTEDRSSRDLGGCVSPDFKGLLLIKVEEGFEVRSFHFESQRRWDHEDTWISVDINQIGEPRVFSKMPIFIWRKTNSAYHFDCDHAVAEIEVVNDPSPEWLVKEMGWGESGGARYILDSYQSGFLTAHSGEGSPASLRGIWKEKYSWDIRSLTYLYLGQRYEREYFADPRSPQIKVKSHSRGGAPLIQVVIRGRVVAEIPKDQFYLWKNKLLSDLDKVYDR